MKHALPVLRVRDILTTASPPTVSAVSDVSSLKKPRKRASAHAILTEGRFKSSDSLGDMLSSAVLAQDKELAGIISEVDELLGSIRTETAEPQAVSNVLQRTVLCAVRQFLLDKELQSLALTDDLTGLYNRRAFLALATQQVKVARRKGNGLLLFFADIDKLKTINDTFGHRAGDFALVRAAGVLEKTFRESDVIARLGGDEFAVLAGEVSPQDQGIILRRLEENLRESNRKERSFTLSFSVGASRLEPKARTTVGELMEQADAAMYQEKRRRKFGANFPTA